MSFLNAAVLILCTGAVIFCNCEPHSKSVPTPTIRFNNGYEIPALGLGTWQAENNECEQAVKHAIDAGYRHIDSAYVYQNEKEVGNAVRAKIAEGVIKREDIFITTKLWNTFHAPELVPRAFQKSLDNLNLTYIDLYLLHWPFAFELVTKDGSKTPPNDLDDVQKLPFRKDGKKDTVDTVDIDFVDTWLAMEELLKTGKVRSLGVSNFNSQQINRLLSVAKIVPVTNQVECHPNFNQKRLLKFCADRNITLTAYSPLGRPGDGGSNLAINDPKVSEIATAHNKSPAQVVLRYTYQNGAIVIPKSVNKDRIKSNIDIFDFNLSQKDMKIIDGLNTNTRMVRFNEAEHSKYYPFNAEF